MFLRKIELQRDYLFQVRLFKDLSQLSSSVKKIFTQGLSSINKVDISTMFANATLLYLSECIKSIRPPTTELGYDEIKMGVLAGIPFLNKVVMSQFEIVFMEDQINSVTKFFQMYQSFLTSYRSAKFTNVNDMSLSMLFSRDMSFPLGQGIINQFPTHVEFYPRIIPIKVDYGTYDKSSDKLAETTVTFARFPVIKDRSQS